MVDNELKYSILQKIVESKPFVNSKKYITLLTYLLDSSIDGNVPKEYTIAIDVFERTKSFNQSEDTIVRYYMHRLRQKIDKYYKEEGREDEIRMVIPKGHYEVKFLQKPKEIKHRIRLTTGRYYP